MTLAARWAVSLDFADPERARRRLREVQTSWVLPSAVAHHGPVAMATAGSGVGSADPEWMLAGDISAHDANPERIHRQIGQFIRSDSEEALGRVPADFAVAVWHRSADTLHLVRDPLGVRPLYVAQLPEGGLLAAGDIPSLLACSAVSREIDDLQAARFLTSEFAGSDGTCFRTIRRLPAAHRMRSSRGVSLVTSWWDAQGREPIPESGARAAIGELEERLVESVERRLIGSKVPGSMLSGGLDSSSIVAIARDANLPRSLQTFSFVLPQNDHGYERPWQIMARTGTGTQAPVLGHEVSIEGLDPVGGALASMRTLGDPRFAPNLFLHTAVYARVAELGCDRLLDGIDGDTTCSYGFGYLPELIAAGRLVKASQLSRQTALRLGYSWKMVFLRAGVMPALSATMRRRVDRLRGNQSEVPVGVMAPDLIKRVAWADAWERERFERPSGIRNERQVHAWTLQNSLLSSTLEAAAAGTATFGIDARFPFCDPELTRLCMAMPGSSKLRDGWTRWHVRTAMNTRLPKDVVWRGSKSRIETPFLTAMAGHITELGEHLVESARNGPLAPFVSAESLRAHVDRMNATTASGAAAMAVWSTAMFSDWLSEVVPVRQVISSTTGAAA